MGKSGYVYCPQVEFADAAGRKIKFQSETGTQQPSYKIGQTVEVLYQKNASQKDEINSAAAL